MAEMLLINPRKRRKAKSAKRRTRRANPVASNPRRRRARRRNPISMKRVTRVRRNPIGRRRRNPIALRGMFSGLVPMLKTAAFGAVGSVAVDYAWGQVNSRLPTMLQTRPGEIGAGDAVKAVATVVIGRALSRFTRGASVQMAQGALTVQADRLIRSYLPATVRSQLAWGSPARVVQGQNWVGPNRVRGPGIAAYTAPGVTPLLSAYTQPGVTPLLSGLSARSREGALR